ncbi:DUF4831 family protein [Mangrovibacterium marinum]|nr:DUF4831 family protein [Mangrovibacterium marinum]
MKTKFLLFALLAAFCVPAFAQRSDKNAMPVLTDGLAYSLPRTGLRIHVQAEREKFFAGPYAQFAEAMLGLKNAPTTDHEKWLITGVRIETFGEADPNQIYKTAGLNGSLINLTDDGVLAAINTAVETRTVAPAVATFADDSSIPAYPFPDLSLNPFFEKPDSASANVLIAKSLQQKAQEAAHTITKLRKRRFKALANAYDEQLPDGKAYAVMVKELDQLEDDYVALFIGKSYKNSFEYSFDYIPGDNSVSGDVVFRFSETKGVLPKTDLSGKPVQIELKKLDELASAQAKQKGATAGVSHIFYRMPGKAELRLMNGVNLLAMARLDIAQFGTVLPVPDELLDGNHTVVFHSTSGAIKNVGAK